MKKLAALIESKRFLESEECDIETDRIKSISVNKTVTLIKKIKDCKPFIGVSILFLCVSIMLIGIMICFYLKVRINNVLLY